MLGILAKDGGAGEDTNQVHHMLAPKPPSNNCPLQVLEMQLQMMLQKLADAEGRQTELERENEGLKDQLCTLQFQSGMIPSEVWIRGISEGGEAPPSLMFSADVPFFRLGCEFV